MRFPRSVAFAATIALVASVPGFLAWRRWNRPVPASIELATPIVAFGHLPSPAGKTLFFSPAATEFLKPHWSEWARHPAMPEGDSSLAPEDVARQFDAAAQNPAAWRALDRNWRFAAALLTGDPAGFRALLDHLRKSPDWTLTWMDHTSIIFERSPARAWTVADLDPVIAGFATHSVSERVEVRVQAAHRLTAIGEISKAKELLDQAVQIDSHSAPVWAELASTHAIFGQWDLALTAADQALAVDKSYLPAIAAKANALYAFGKFNEALALTRRLVVEAPQDGLNLELHAKVTHAAHAHQEEIEVLLKIIELSKAKALPTGTWRIYLGQAYAEDGQGELALRQFETALKEPNLPHQERAFAEKAIKRIQGRERIL